METSAFGMTNYAVWQNVAGQREQLATQLYLMCKGNIAEQTKKDLLIKAMELVE